MEQYINKSALVAEIESLLDKGRYHEEYDCAYRDGNNGALYALKSKLNTLEVKDFWKSADGPDLPIFDREVVVLIKYSTQRNIHDEEYPTYRVGFGHRPNPNGWDGKNIDTNEVTHYTPKLYDNGGWNQPHILYWLDAKLPYEENKIIK